MARDLGRPMPEAGSRKPEAGSRKPEAGSRKPEAGAVTLLNVHGIPVAEELWGRFDGGGFLLADGNDDGSKLFDRAAERGSQLLVPPPKNAGKEHHDVSPYRRRRIALRAIPLGQAVRALRRGIEQSFGNAMR